jgi:hypothetical protein
MSAEYDKKLKRLIDHSEVVSIWETTRDDLGEIFDLSLFCWLHAKDRIAFLRDLYQERLKDLYDPFDRE